MGGWHQGSSRFLFFLGLRRMEEWKTLNPKPFAPRELAWLDAHDAIALSSTAITSIHLHCRTALQDYPIPRKESTTSKTRKQRA